MNIKLLVVEDCALVREGLIRILTADREIEVVGSARSGLEALQKAKELNPDIVLMDRCLPGLDGVAATRLITREITSTKVVLLSLSENCRDETILEAVQAGARGFVSYGANAANLIQHVKHAASGGVALSEEITGKLLDSLASNIKAANRRRAEPDLVLTAREKAVLNLVCQGAPNKQIAASLVVSENTVRAHVRSLMQKLDADNRTRLAVYAIKYGFGLREEIPPAESTFNGSSWSSPDRSRGRENGHDNLTRGLVRV